jgi:hypothetical protein
MIVKSIVVLSLLLSLCNADTNVTTQQESNYIDETHTTLSKEVLEWSDTIDTTLSSWVGNDEINTTTVGSNVSDNTLENKVKIVDSFFQNNKYLNETEETFIRVRVGSNFQSKRSNDFDLRFKVQLPLSKSKKSLKIFVDDITLDNAKNILRDDSEDDRSAPDIGVHYFSPKTYGIESKYSLGLSGIYPFVKARYNLPFKINEWLIDPVQVFKYSIRLMMNLKKRQIYILINHSKNHHSLGYNFTGKPKQKLMVWTMVFHSNTIGAQKKILV